MKEVLSSERGMEGVTEVELANTSRMGHPEPDAHSSDSFERNENSGRLAFQEKSFQESRSRIEKSCAKQ